MPAKLEAFGIQPMPMASAAFANFARPQQKVCSSVIKAVHIRLDR